MKQTLLYILLLTTQCCFCQKKRDTTAMIAEFNKVMEFAVQPNLYYTGNTSLHTTPAIRTTNGDLMLHNTFYKVKEDLFYGNEQEDVYLQDSFLITVNRLRKTIQVNKVDVASKTNMNLLPLKKMNFQKILREHFTISKEKRQGDTLELSISSLEKNLAQGMGQTEMKVLFSAHSFLPYAIEMSIEVWQPASEQFLAILNNQAGLSENLVMVKDGIKYIKMTQTVALNFTQMDLSGEKALQMPSWKSCLGFNQAEQSFRGKDKYENYEVIQTF